MADARSGPIVDHTSGFGSVVVQVRGSLLVSSLQTLRELDFFERYLASLPRAMHEPVLYALASSWLPIEVAMAHYAACDAMQLDDRSLAAIGERVSARIMGGFVSTILRGARPVGANIPMIALPAFPRFYDRILQGGKVRVDLTGPKDALVETAGVPMFRYRYFRLAYGALVRGAGLMMTNTLYARQRSASDSSVVLALSWV